MVRMRLLAPTGYRLDVGLSTYVGNRELPTYVDIVYLWTNVDR